MPRSLKEQCVQALHFYHSADLRLEMSSLVSLWLFRLLPSLYIVSPTPPGRDPPRISLPPRPLHSDFNLHPHVKRMQGKVPRINLLADLSGPPPLILPCVRHSRRIWKYRCISSVACLGNATQCYIGRRGRWFVVGDHASWTYITKGIRPSKAG